MRHAIDTILRTYQKTISPDHGLFSGLFPYGFCRFTPSCSQYARDAVRTHGIFYGGTLAIKRIFCCNPFTKSRHDPVQ